MNDLPDQLVVESFLDGGRRVVALAGELDLATAPLAEQALQREVDVVDLSGLEFMDSAGIRILLRVTGARGDPLVIRGVRRSVRRILELTRVCDLVVFEDDATDRIGSSPRG